MFSENRKFHFIGELTLKRSRVLDEQYQPKDDTVNWLFLFTKEWHYSFIYKIENPLEAKYGKPFKAEIAFTAIETVAKIIKLNHTYEVLRGQESVGTIKLLSALS